MISFLFWYGWIVLIGLVTFPITFRLLTRLPDRGYSAARVLGLLLWGYFFWMTATLGFSQNDLGGVIFAFILLLALSGVMIRGKWQEMLSYLRKHWRMVLATELVFLAAFGFWTLVRAANPALIGTEKPMELAFINAILKSPSFPPNDPWLSGFSISYYYFGYVIVSMLVRVTGTAATVAFNLMVSLLFGLVAVSGFGLLNNLLALRKPHDTEVHSSRFQFSGLAAPLFTLLLGNWEGFLELLHARGIGWNTAPDGSLVSRFWSWLSIPEIENPPFQPFQWTPNRSGGGYWWWRASRVLQDFKLNGDRIEIIDEFPQFSFILADLHPHVLTMPFVLLAVSVVLNIYLSGMKSAEGKKGILSLLVSRLDKNELGDGTDRSDLFILQWLRDPLYWLFVIITGGIAFMNTWDFPIYVGLLCLAVVLAQYRQHGWSIKRLVEFFETGILTGILSILLYLPYYFGFGSQAGGFLPSLNFYTRGIYFWIMFGVMLVPIVFWLVGSMLHQKHAFVFKTAWKIGLVVIGGGWSLSYIMAGLLDFLGSSTQSTNLLQTVGLIQWLQGSDSMRSIITESLINRLNQPGTWITLGGLLVLVWASLSGMHKQEENGSRCEHRGIDGFVMILVLLGIGLTMVPEFVYLQDQFGTRMNTIFKFYFQTWIVWGIAPAYSLIVVMKEGRRLFGSAAKLMILLAVVMGSVYPIFAIWQTTDGFSPKQVDAVGNEVPYWNLDGASYRWRSNENEMMAIQWLQQAPLGVVAEAVGGSYTDFARAATYSGQPTVLGWPGHESQWRGGNEEMGNRESDIETLYRSNRWDQVQAVLDQYNIRYVFVGNLERSQYNANTRVFDVYLVPVFTADTTTVYEYQPQSR